MSKYKKLISIILLLILANGLNVESVFSQSTSSLNETLIPSSISDTDINFDGTLLAIATLHEVQLFSTITWQTVAVIPTVSQYVSVDWSNFINRLAITDETQINIIDWDGTSTTNVETLSASLPQTMVSWSPNDKFIVSAESIADSVGPGEILTLQIWETQSWNLMHTINTRFAIKLNGIYSLNDIFDWNGFPSTKLAIVASQAHLENGVIYEDTATLISVIDVNSGIVETTISLQFLPAYSIDWCPHRGLIAIGGQFGYDLYDDLSGMFLEPSGSTIDTDAIAWDPSCRYIATNNVIYDTVNNVELAYLSKSGGVIEIHWSSDSILPILVSNTDSNNGNLSSYDLSLIQSFDIPEKIVQFSLIDANTNLPIPEFDSLVSGSIINLSNLFTSSFYIQAIPNPTTVGNVVFDLENLEINQVVASPPYYFDLGMPVVGEYSITATPVSNNISGIPFSISFSISDGVFCDIYVSTSDTPSLIAAITTGNGAGSPYTICLENGTYTFTASDNSDTYGANALPVITGDITIIGNGAIIERDVNAPNFRFFRVEGSGTLTLDNLTLQNGVTSGTGADGDGGAIHNRGTLNVVDATLTNNTANIEAGAIYNDTNASVTITDSVISNNTAIADDGGAIDNHGSLVISGSTFEYNSSTNNDGGAFWNDSNASIDISDSIIRYNTANNDGGAIRNFGSVSISDTIIDNNTALTDDGGAISSDTGTTTVTNGSLNNNHAIGDDGGAIATYGPLTLSNVTVDSNTSSNDGGAVYADSLNVSVDNQSTFSNNTAGQDGGAIYIRGSSSAFTLIDSTFLSNTAPRNGGAIYFDNGSNAISNTLFQANSASNHGGAIFFDDGSLNITANTIFESNQATEDGGAIFTNENITISDSIFRFNSAGDQGGAVRAERSSASFIVNSCIHDNTASYTSGLYMTVSNFDATYNWWGASDGPGGSGTGSGDEVNNNVNYANFITTSCVDAFGANGMSSQLLALTPNSSNTPSDAGDPSSYPVVVLPYEDNFDTADDWFGTVRWEQDNSAGRTGGAWLIDTSVRGQVNTLEMTTWAELANNPQIRLDYAEQAQLSSGDIVTLEIQVQGNANWTVLSQSVGGSYTWQDRSISLADYRGQTVRLRWRVEVSTDVPVGETSTQYAIDDLVITRR